MKPENCAFYLLVIQIESKVPLSSRFLPLICFEMAKFWKAMSLCVISDEFLFSCCNDCIFSLYQIPTAPPTNDEAAADDVILDVVKTTSPLIERSQNVLFKFLPQLSQSVFGNLEETMMLKPCSASATPEEATPERDIPIVVQEQPKMFVNEDQDQFTDLVNWQKASIVSTVTEEGIGT